MTGSLPSPRAEISDGSFEPLEVESVRSNDAALVAAKANGFHDFDVEVAGNVSAEAAFRLRGKLRARELVELRKLLEGEPRFSVLLDRHCKAVHELILCKNPAPVLAVLAGLVWSSLSIAWELDTSHMPKARMKMQLEELRVKLAKVLQDLSRSRSSYLKELVSHREKLRRFDELSMREIERLVHEEQPVMFYEPLNYLDDETKVHVSEVIEEKLKLLLKRLQMPAPLDLKHFLAMEVPEVPPVEEAKVPRTERSEEEEEKAALAQRERELDIKEVRLRAQMEEMRAARQTLEGEMSQKLQEAEARHSKSQMVAAEFKANFQQAQAELASIAKAARKEWQELASIRGEQLPQAPSDGVSAQTLLMQLFRLEGQVREQLLGATEKKSPKGVSNEDVAALEQQQQNLKVQVQDLRKEVAAAEAQKLEATAARKQQAQELAELQGELEKERRHLEEMKQTCQQLEKQREPQELQKAVPQATQSQQPKVLPELQKTKQELQATQLELEKTREELQELRRTRLEETETCTELGESQERSKAATVIDQVQDPRVSNVTKEAPTHPVHRRQSAQNTAEKAIQVDTGAYFEVQETRSPSEPGSSKKPVLRKAPERCDKTDKTTQVELEREAAATGREVAVQPGLRGENQHLRFEVSRLQKVLLELQDQLRGLAARQTGGEIAFPRVPDFPWKSTDFHLSKVHERLYLDAYERQERQRALQETIQRAREFEVLDVFRSQHPWLNPARNAQESETYAWSICSANWSSIEGLEETTQVTQVAPAAPEPILDPLKPSVSSRRSSRLVPSPRSPEPGDSLEAEGVSPGEYLPLVVCSLEGGDEARQRRPSSSTPTLLGRSATGKRRGGLPLSGEVLRPVRPTSAASGLQPRKVQEGLRLLASKPGEVKTPTKALARPKSVGSLRCLL